MDRNTAQETAITPLPLTIHKSHILEILNVLTVEDQERLFKITTLTHYAHDKERKGFINRALC